MVHCKKCGYYDKKISETASKAGIIVGFCRLRNKYISDQSINNQHCKDKAIVDVNVKTFERQENEIKRQKHGEGVVTY